MEILGSTLSLKAARRILDNLVVGGDWKVQSYGTQGPVYVRDGGKETLHIEKKGTQWEIIREGGINAQG